jgi:hypothetical protein
MLAEAVPVKDDLRQTTAKPAGKPHSLIEKLSR